MSPERIRRSSAGLAKIDMRTGRIERIFEGRAAGNGRRARDRGRCRVLGDITQVLRAFDAETGKVLWQSEPLGATFQTSTITYASTASQYIAVINAESLLGSRRLADAPASEHARESGTSINVFALRR